MWVPLPGRYTYTPIHCLLFNLGGVVFWTAGFFPHLIKQPIKLVKNTIYYVNFDVVSSGPNKIYMPWPFPVPGQAPTARAHVLEPLDLRWVYCGWATGRRHAGDWCPTCSRVSPGKEVARSRLLILEQCVQLSPGSCLLQRYLGCTGNRQTCLTGAIYHQGL